MNNFIYLVHELINNLFCDILCNYLDIEPLYHHPGIGIEPFSHPVLAVRPSFTLTV